jgi:hypothetical protein
MKENGTPVGGMLFMVSWQLAAIWKVSWGMPKTVHASFAHDSPTNNWHEF